MDLNDLGNLGEFVSAMAVIASLAYLAIQVRLHTKTVKSGTLESLLSKSTSIYFEIAGHPYMPAIFQKIAVDEPLTREDYYRYSAFMMGIMCALDNEYEAFAAGNLADSIHRGYTERLRDMFTSDVAKGWWAASRSKFSEPFQAYVDVVIGPPDSTPVSSEQSASPMPQDS